MDDDQNNQIQPGQTFQPGQVTQPTGAVEPVTITETPAPPITNPPVVQPTPPQAPQQTQPPPPPQQPMPQPQPMPQQQSPTPQPAPLPQVFQQPPLATQYPTAPTQASKSRFSKKLILIIVGIILVIGITATILLSSSSSSSQLSLEAISSKQISFSISLPTGWTTSETSLTNYTVINAKPANLASDDETSISIARDTTSISAADFITNVNAEVERIGTKTYQDIFNLEITDIQSENYGTETSPAFKLTYTKHIKDKAITHSIVNYFIYQEDKSVVSARFTFSPAYADLNSTIDAILSSYQVAST